MGGAVCRRWRCAAQDFSHPCEFLPPHPLLEFPAGISCVCCWPARRHPHPAVHSDASHRGAARRCRQPYGRHHHHRHLLRCVVPGCHRPVAAAALPVPWVQRGPYAVQQARTAGGAALLGSVGTAGPAERGASQRRWVCRGLLQQRQQLPAGAARAAGGTLCRAFSSLLATALVHPPASPARLVERLAGEGYTIVAPKAEHPLPFAVPGLPRGWSLSPGNASCEPRCLRASAAAPSPTTARRPRPPCPPTTAPRHHHAQAPAARTPTSCPPPACCRPSCLLWMRQRRCPRCRPPTQASWCCWATRVRRALQCCGVSCCRAVPCCAVLCCAVLCKPVRRCCRATLRRCALPIVQLAGVMALPVAAGCLQGLLTRVPAWI